MYWSAAERWFEVTDRIEHRSLTGIAAAQNNIHSRLGMPFEALYAAKPCDCETVNNGRARSGLTKKEQRYLSQDTGLRAVPSTRLDNPHDTSMSPRRWLGQLRTVMTVCRTTPCRGSTDGSGVLDRSGLRNALPSAFAPERQPVKHLPVELPPGHESIH
jgi:hypothetical protein